MRLSRLAPTALVPVFLLFASLAPAHAQDRSLRPTSPGREARHDGWNSDGAPRPPRMWRGHGGTKWTDHYHACRKAYGSRYEHRTDMVRRGNRRSRCVL